MSRLALVLLVAACDAGAPPAKPTVVAAAPAKPPAPPPPHTVLASIHREACYGRCPIYSLVIYRDGAAEYDGERFVKTVGHVTGHVTLDQVAALDKLFTSHGYLGLKDAYVSYDMTDSSSAETSYHPAEGKPKTIAHYHGDTSAPAILDEIEDGFDQVVKSDQWIGTKAEREQLGR